ncbi:MAG TPA: N,N-dimethylformamidase beta subunit family domain-containing protein [Ferrovibrio sp.]|uniref:N,N-dimethylformamidase beta subunit family domain-containing protein n=1 Tax=Ferrovibrio sp. TaxID=1917215 RepID=UPI002ED4537D
MAEKKGQRQKGNPANGRGRPRDPNGPARQWRQTTASKAADPAAGAASVASAAGSDSAAALLGAANPDVWGAFMPRPQGFDALLARFYERPVDDRSRPQIWCYTDRLSYRPGESLRIHGCSSRDRATLTIYRDDLQQTPLIELPAVALPFDMPPADFIEQGCGWPVVAQVKLPTDLPSGFYIIRAAIEDGQGGVREQEHGFFVLPGAPGARARLLLIAATSTWAAYNDWGGACSYCADSHPQGLSIAPRLSIHRPYAKGFIWLPENAPRKLHDVAPGPGEITRYPQFEFAFQRGYSRYYANAGWACYERLFAHWAERNGFALDFASQHDLHFSPELLDAYRCVVIVGHDEYWSWEMREAVERYLAKGGHVARFAGNFAWQIRLEAAGSVQVCYNRLARSHDPLMGTAQQSRVTTCWEDPLINWPGAKTLGLNGLWGIYAGFGSLVGHGSGGFTVYRPQHWALAGTGLGYGDQLGAAARIFGYEVDGLDYVIRDGLPQPTGRDGAPEGIEIIAMGLAHNRETAGGLRGEMTYLPDETPFFAFCRYGEDTPLNRDKAGRGSGMIITMPFGRGEVFNAGTIDWVAGLKRGDAATQIVTRNVLQTYAGD